MEMSSEQQSAGRAKLEIAGEAIHRAFVRTMASIFALGMEGEAPAEPRLRSGHRLGGSLALRRSRHGFFE